MQLAADSATAFSLPEPLGNEHGLIVAQSQNLASRNPPDIRCAVLLNEHVQSACPWEALHDDGRIISMICLVGIEYGSVFHSRGTPPVIVR
jgi:hypothetical protein